LRLDNGEPLIVFHSGSGMAASHGPGTRVLARWDGESNRVVRDEDSPPPRA
jgi:hypothetical protein